MKSGYKILFQGNENVLKLTVVTAAQLCKYTRDYGIVYFTWGNCMLYELYFNKTATKHIQNVVWRHNTVKSRQDMTEINLKLKNPYPFLCVAARGSLYLSGLKLILWMVRELDFRISEAPSGSSIIWVYGIILNYLMKTSVLILALLRFSSTISANLVGVISLAGVSIKRRARFCPEAKRTPLCQASWSSLAEENTRSPSDSLSEHWPQPARRALTEDKRKVMDRGCPHIFFVIWTREAAVMVYKELERLSWWVQRLRPWVSTAGGAGLIPGQGTKARHASWHGQKQK